MNKQGLFTLMLLSTTFGWAQEVELVKDIYPGGSSYPLAFFEY